MPKKIPEPQEYHRSAQEIIEEETIRSSIMLKHSTIDFAKALTLRLNHLRRIPGSYYIGAAQELGISRKTAASWKLHQWPLEYDKPNWPIYDILLVLINVFQRTAPPTGEDETFDYAMQRFRDRIQNLKDDGYTHNQLAQYLRMTHKSLEHLIKGHRTERAYSPPRVCPWTLLQKLEKAPEIIEEQIRRKDQMKGVIQQQRAEQWIDDRPTGETLPYVLTLPRIAAFDPCIKCKAKHGSLYKIDDDEIRGIPIYKCRLCGAEQCIIDTIQPEYVAHYTTCGHCHYPWHNMRQADQYNTDEHKAYYCVICNGINMVLWEEVNGTKPTTDHH